MALLGRHAEQRSGLLLVLRYPYPLLVHDAQRGLRPHLTLLGRLAIPECRLGVVLRDATAAAVHLPEDRLRLRLPLLRKGGEFLQRQRELPPLESRDPLLQTGLRVRASHQEKY